jgi:hypothetical protein
MALQPVTLKFYGFQNYLNGPVFGENDVPVTRQRFGRDTFQRYVTLIDEDPPVQIPFYRIDDQWFVDDEDVPA